MTSHQARQPKGTPTGGEFATARRPENGTTLDASARPHQGQSPREIDEQLAEHYTALSRVTRQVAEQVDTAHHKLGHRRATTRARVGQGWQVGPEETLEQLRHALDAGSLPAYDVPSAERLLTRVDELRSQRDELREQIRSLDEEFVARGGWSRFFLVTSSAGGHIHSSLDCRTCKPTTEFGWQPQLSGKSEPDAVAEHGAILCTACFPSAPVEWTRGAGPSPDTCPGSGKQSATALRFNGRSRYGTCPECGSIQTVGYSGIRKHKRA